MKRGLSGNKKEKGHIKEENIKGGVDMNRTQDPN